MNWPTPTDQERAQRAARKLLSERYAETFVRDSHKPEPQRTHDAADEFIGELAAFMADHPLIQVRYQQFVERKRSAAISQPRSGVK